MDRDREKERTCRKINNKTPNEQFHSNMGLLNSNNIFLNLIQAFVVFQISVLFLSLFLFLFSYFGHLVCYFFYFHRHSFFFLFFIRF